MTGVGFVGLGTMGAAMARRLVNAGHSVHIWNRSQRAVKPLVDAGAVMVDAPADALAQGVAFSMLADDAAAQSVFSDSVLRSVPDTAHINMATVSVACARDLHERHVRAGVHYAAAPVLGRPAVAADGGLNIVVAGSPIALDRAEEFFPIFGKRVWSIGQDPAQANLVKIAVNYNLIHAIQAIAESVNLIERGGVDAQTFMEILTDTSFTGSAYRGYGSLISDRAYLKADFTVGLGMKDLELARSAALETSSALPTSDVLHEIFATALADPELSQLDWSAVAEITRRRGG